MFLVIKKINLESIDVVYIFEFMKTDKKYKPKIVELEQETIDRLKVLADKKGWKVKVYMEDVLRKKSLLVK